MTLFSIAFIYFAIGWFIGNIGQQGSKFLHFLLKKKEHSILIGLLISMIVMFMLVYFTSVFSILKPLG